MTETPSSDNDVAPPGQGSEGRRRAYTWRFWVVSALVGLLVFVFAAPLWLTSSPSRCASCHEMRPYYESWLASSHRGAAPNCAYCHAKPGVVGFVAYELGAYHDVVAHFSGAQVRTDGVNSPSVASCSRSDCHSLNRETSNAGDIKINHRLHVTRSAIPCTRCHPGAVHEGVGGRQKLPPITLCKSCHADKMSDCGYCHAVPHSGPAPSGH